MIIALVTGQAFVPQPTYNLSMHELCKMPLVCRAFCRMFNQQSQLTKTVSFHDLTSINLDSLLAWVKKHGRQVKQVFADNPAVHSLDTAAMLRALVSCKAPVQTLELYKPSSAMLSVSAFKTLTHCALRVHSKQARLDLKPLKALPCLVNLSLANGIFVYVEAAVHLTSLYLENCTASCSQDCRCVSSLRDLDMYQASMAGFHNRGLGACSQLMSLTCTASSLAAGHAWQSEDLIFHGNVHQVPVSLTALRSLTHLNFCSSAAEYEVSLDWLTCLPALQVLDAGFYCNNVVLPSCLSMLTNLRALSAQAYAGEVMLVFDFKALSSLTSIELCGTVRASWPCVLSDIASLADLRIVAFTHCKWADMGLVALAHKLGKDRLDVRFSASMTSPYGSAEPD